MCRYALFCWPSHIFHSLYCDFNRILLFQIAFCWFRIKQYIVCMLDTGITYINYVMNNPMCSYIDIVLVPVIAQYLATKWQCYLKRLYAIYKAVQVFLYIAIRNVLVIYAHSTSYTAYYSCHGQLSCIFQLYFPQFGYPAYYCSCFHWR